MWCAKEVCQISLLFDTHQSMCASFIENSENGKEMLSMNEVLLYLLKSAKHIVEEADLLRLAEMDIPKWEDWVESIRAMIISKPGMVRTTLSLISRCCGRFACAVFDLCVPNERHFAIEAHSAMQPAHVNRTRPLREVLKL